MSVFLPNSLPVTSLYAGFVGLGFVLSSLQVGLTRANRDKMYGTKDDQDLEHKSRAQGNFIEYGAFGVTLLALLEYNSVLSAGTLWWWGLAFTTLRFSHALQLNAPSVFPKPLRAISFMGTLALLAFASIRLLLHGLK